MTSDRVADRLAQLTALHPKKIDLSLGRMADLMEKLDHPQRALAPVIHVAGTNGKGSTCAAIRAIAEAAGLRVHAYSSPHLVRFHERIRLNGKLISDDYLVEVLDRVEAANDGDPITFFESTTAAAFVAMAENPADLVILEVGLGGRLDATNVIEDCAAAVITPVGFDHQEFLGSSLDQIAGEKAGIIRSDRPVVVAAQRHEALTTICAQAKDVGATAHLSGIDWRIDIEGPSDSFRVTDRQGDIDLPRPHLVGMHQIFNSGLAVAALRVQEAVHIPDAAYRAGMGWIRWPGRLQQLTDTPLNALLPDGAQLLADGGHNADAGQVLRNYLRGLDTLEGPVTLIVGMMKNKDFDAFLSPLATQALRLIAVPIPGEDCAAPADLAAKAGELGMRGTVASGIEAALRQISVESHSDRPPTVLITGSLYLVGHTLAAADCPPQ